jgi:hypothetical protein
MTKTVDLTSYIQRLVDDAPPLSPDQRDRLALLLRPSNPKETP